MIEHTKSGPREVANPDNRHENLAPPPGRSLSSVSSSLTRLPRIDVAYALITTPDTGKILMVCNRRKNGSSWSLPGGTREPGETFEQTAVREVREETGLHVEVGGLVAVGERFRDAHALIFTFLARVVGGKTSLQRDEEVVRLDWASVETAENRMPWYPGGVGSLVGDPGAVHYSEYL